MTKFEKDAEAQRQFTQDEITRIAREHDITRADLLGPRRTNKLVNARAALAQALREAGLTYRAIGLAIKRDATSVRGLLNRRVSPPKKAKTKLPQVAYVTEAERLFTEMRKRGSAALLMAIFATGKTHGPITPEQEVEAVRLAQRYRKPLQMGWLSC